MVPRQAQVKSPPSAGDAPAGDGRPAGFDAARALRLAQETFDIEAAAVLGLKARTD